MRVARSTLDLRANPRPSMSNTAIRRTGIPEFSELVLACRHRPLGTLIVGISISILACCAAWSLIPATFQSESFIHIRQREDVVFTPQSSRSEDLMFVRAQTQLALSPQVLSVAIADDGLRKWCELPTSTDGIATLRSWLRTDVQTGAEVLSISAVHRSADVSHAASLAVTRAYLDEVTSRQSSDQGRRRQELEAAANNAELVLDRLWDELNQIATQLGSNDSQSLAMRDQVQIQAYRDYAQQLRVVQTKRHELQTRLSELESKRSAPPAIAPQAMRNPRDQRARPSSIASAKPDRLNAEQLRWQNRIVELDERIRQIRSVAADPNTARLDPYFAERRIAIEMLRSTDSKGDKETPPRHDSLDEKRAQYSPTPKVHLKPQSVVDDVHQEIAQIKQQLKANTSERDFLQAQMAEIDSKINQTEDQNGVQLEMARHAVERQSRLADGLWQSLEELKIESQSQPRVKLMKLADYPLQANQSKRLKITAAAFGVAWLITVLVFGFVEWQSCLVRSSDDVVAATSVPVFGIDRGTPTTRSPLAGGSYSEAGEAAARLMLANGRRQQIASVFVTSVTDAEPRERTALKLAEAFAGYRRRTLLIDCDASSLRLARQLKATEQAGILQLEHDADRTMSHVVPTELEDLDVLPLGQCEDGSPWVDSQSLRRVLGAVRRQYDAIVVNGPAMLSTGDSLLLASQTDQVLLAVFVGQTNWNQIRVCQDVITATDVPLTGMIVARELDDSSPAICHERSANIREHRPIDSTVANTDADVVDELQMRDHIASLQNELRRSMQAQADAPEPLPCPTDVASSVIPHKDRPAPDPNS